VECSAVGPEGYGSGTEGVAEIAGEKGTSLVLSVELRPSLLSGSKQSELSSIACLRLASGPYQVRIESKNQKGAL
jgi:hypothetical protein